MESALRVQAYEYEYRSGGYKNHNATLFDDVHLALISQYVKNSLCHISQRESFINFFGKGLGKLFLQKRVFPYFFIPSLTPIRLYEVW